MDTRETGGGDPLDSRFSGPAAPVRLRAIDYLLRTRAVLGLQPLTAPALVFVPLGVLLGPNGLNVLTASAIGHLDPVVTVALAALGIFVGMALDLRTPTDRRLLGIASLEALMAFAAVASATLFLMRSWGLEVDAGTTLVACALGVCASVSSAGAPDHPGEAHRVATRIADLDDGLALIAGAAVVAAVHQRNGFEIVGVLALTALVGLLAGLAGWLLFERAHSDAERGVFVLGALALVGGAADYVQCSPLLAGMIAGFAWRWLPGHADRIIRTDVSRFQHPLVLLLLVVAGALVDLTPVALWLLGPFVVFRLVGKVLGAYAASALAQPIRPGDMAAYLLPPGLLGIAVALNFVQTSASPTATAVATAVAVGTLASEVLALMALPGSTPD